MIKIDLNKQQAIKQIDFTGNLNRIGCAALFFVVEEVKEAILNFLQEIGKV